jgi:hypothetical protein
LTYAGQSLSLANDFLPMMVSARNTVLQAVATVVPVRVNTEPIIFFRQGDARQD